MNPSMVSSGGTALVEILNILEGYDLAKLGNRSAVAIHLTVEAFRRAFYDRAEFLGDPDFANIPVPQLIDKRWLVIYERLAKKHGRAVVPVEGKTCLGCFQGLPGSFYSETSADQVVKLCENCGRILYLLTR